MYNIIYGVLNSKYKLIKGKIKDYFYDEYGQIVATVDKKSITMYYDFPKCSRDIWNHKGKVVVSFIKEYNVNGKICDVFLIAGLCGACNDVIVHEDYEIDITVNHELCNNPLQEAFNQLNNEDKKIKLLERLTGCKAENANLENVCLFGSRAKLGNCGNIQSEKGYANFDICGLIHIENCILANFDYYSRYINKINSSEKDINVVYESKNDIHTDYNSIYNYYRKKYDWHYTTGYDNIGAPEMRSYVESKKYQTVDCKSIYKKSLITVDIDKLNIEKFEKLINRIFNSYTTQSLNSVRLQMIRELKNLIPGDYFKINVTSLRMYNYAPFW